MICIGVAMSPFVPGVNFHALTGGRSQVVRNPPRKTGHRARLGARFFGSSSRNAAFRAFASRAKRHTSPMEPEDITIVLQQIEHGDEQAAARLLPMVYEQLRSLAAARMAHEAAGNTLQPTALVHEAWLRLGGDQQPDWKSRAHFFGAAAEAMRRILIDRARKRLAQRRGGRQERVNIDDIDLADATEDARIILSLIHI